MIVCPEKGQGVYGRGYGRTPRNSRITIIIY
jgi:hypothetical protein